MSSIWHKVKTGNLDPKEALKMIEEFGGTDTQTYRRVKNFINKKQKPKPENENE